MSSRRHNTVECLTSPTQYLKKVLERETFKDDDDEIEELRDHRDSIKALLIAHFSESNPSIRWAGSMAKGTMVRTSYGTDGASWASMVASRSSAP